MSWLITIEMDYIPKWMGRELQMTAHELMRLKLFSVPINVNIAIILCFCIILMKGTVTFNLISEDNIYIYIYLKSMQAE